MEAPDNRFLLQIISPTVRPQIISSTGLSRSKVFSPTGWFAYKSSHPRVTRHLSYGLAHPKVNSPSRQFRRQVVSLTGQLAH